MRHAISIFLLTFALGACGELQPITDSDGAGQENTVIAATDYGDVGVGAAPKVGSDADFNLAWHACDEAATDAAFPYAALPTTEPKRLGRVVPQVAGKHQGKTLIVLSVPTGTGHVFCMTELDYRVVHYKFNGRVVVDRD